MPSRLETSSYAKERCRRVAAETSPPPLVSYTSSPTNSYDELFYKCNPIEWTAPERLALASMLHGGPRPPLETYRVLELGCGNGANLLPMAYYRRCASFIGVDSARSQIEIAQSRRDELGLSNIEFIHADFLTATTKLSGEFDYIIGHGIFSWVPEAVRDAIMDLCAIHLRYGGVLYLNYNTYPGWKVRGLIRDFLRAQVKNITNLSDRARKAQEISAQVVLSMEKIETPYSQLLANEFRFVCENHFSYVGHEFLAEHNQPYWRSEFLALTSQYGFEYVADADFNYDSGRISEDLASSLSEESLTGRSLDDAIDLLCYRQLHSPILTKFPFKPQHLKEEVFSKLFIASCLSACPLSGEQNTMFEHPSGYQVEAKEENTRKALERLAPLWPRGQRIGDVFSKVNHVRDDLTLLHRNGLIELRCIEPSDFGIDRVPLNRLEGQWNDSVTSPYHTREAILP